MTRPTMVDLLATDVACREQARPLYRSKPMEIWPGQTSGEPQDVAMRIELYKRLTDAFPPDITPEGYLGPTGIANAWESVLSIPGFGDSPVSWPLASSMMVRKEKGLPEGWRSDRDRAIWQELIEIFFTDPVFSGVASRDGTSSGFPTFARSGPMKSRMAEHSLANFQAIKPLIKRKDYRNLLMRHGIAYAYSPNVRIQPESPRKVRFFADERSRFTGRLSPTDKSIPGLPPEVGAQRTRLVYGGCWQSNTINSASINPFQKSFVSRFPFTLKHRTPREICRKIGAACSDLVSKGIAWRAFSIDFGGFDQTQSQLFYKDFFSQMEKVWSEEVVANLRLSMLAPVWMRPWSKKAEKDHPLGLWSYDPKEVDETADPGMPSGNFLVVAGGALCGLLDVLTRIDAVTKDVLGGVIKYLKGEGMVKFIAKGDDIILIGPDEVMNRIEKMMDDVSSGYFDTKREDGMLFLGHFYYPDPTREGGWWFRSNMLTLVHGHVTAERDFRNPLRAGAAIGHAARIINHQGHPSFAAVSTILEDVRAQFYPNLPSIATSMQVQFADAMRRIEQLALRKVDRMKADFFNSGLYPTEVDMLVLADPDLIHYRFEEDQVSPWVLDIIRNVGNIGAVKIFNNQCALAMLDPKEDLEVVPRTSSMHSSKWEIV